MRKLLLALTTVTATATAGALSVSLLPGSVSAATTHSVWGTCQPEPGDVLDARQQCTTIRVPLDYQHPSGPQISLAVSRISTAAPGQRRGVLLLIPGGPGGAGLDLPSTRGVHLPAAVLARYDIVGFDPRGVGQSSPVSCDLAPADTDARVLMPWPGPGGDISANVARARRIASACARNGGPLIRHISTPNEARDIDRIREALGERRLSYWGVSYGTYAGAVYATMFPNRTDRVVLDSNDDPNPKLLARGWVANFAIGAEDRFPDFAAWAAARNDTYDLGTTPAAVRAAYLRLAATLDRAPRPDLDGAALRSLMFNTLYSNDRFPILAAFLHAVDAGTALPPSPFPPPGVLANLVTAQTATGCNDVAWPRSVGGYAKAVARNRVRFPLTDGMPVNIYSCAFWPFPPSEQPVRVTSNGPSNVLMVQNRRDPATPYAGALRMRAALGNRARLVTVDSGGHEAYLANGNACGDAAVTAFLAGGTFPARDIAC